MSETTAEVLRRAGEMADGEHPDEAVEICSAVLMNEPDHPGALYIMGCVMLKSQRHVVAV